MDSEESVDEVLIDLVPGSEDGKVSKNHETDEFHEFIPEVPDDIDSPVF